MKRGKFLALLGGIVTSPVLIGRVLEEEKPNLRKGIYKMTAKNIYMSEEFKDAWSQDDFTAHLTKHYNILAQKWLKENETRRG